MTKYCIITGTSGDIGNSLAKIFSENRYTVIGIDYIEPGSNNYCNHFIQADLEKFADSDIYASTIITQIKKILNGAPVEILINNAAVQILGSIENLTREDWAKTLNTNLIAIFFLSQSLLKELESVGGCILNISSIHAHLTKPNFMAYSVSKSALSSMTKSMAINLGKRVRVNAIEPAAIDTKMLRAGFQQDEAAISKLQNTHPVKEIGNSHNLAKFAYQICTMRDIFLTGSIFTYDGGISSVLNDIE
jgi:NAD(P)-dependent dehydrogenase (short-subunit alcohol dehydrogenase family)